MIRQLRPLLAALLLAIAAVPSIASTASAHPLGNFTVNHLSIVSVAPDAVHVRYILDLAEIPTLQETNAGTIAATVSQIPGTLDLRVGGTPAPLRVDTSTVERLTGQAGLETLRVTLELSAPGNLRDGAAVAYRDLSFPGRIGWHDVVFRGAVGGASVGPDEPTNELRSYPADVTAAPQDRLAATATVKLSANVGGTNVVPADPVRFAIDTNADRLTGFLRTGGSDAAALIAALGVAMFLGALHALGPGHGKAMVAAYLVGSKGTAKQAIILGSTVTITHTLGVYALGFVTLVAAQFFLPEKLYPVLGVISGLLVVIIGVGLLRSRLRSAPLVEQHAHEHEHDHTHGDGAGQHRHDAPVGLRGLLALGISGGLLPCPTALVVLLAAVSFHNVLLGMILVAAFSVGLAGVLMGIGLALVWGQGLIRSNSGAMRLAGSRLAVRATRYLPAASAAAITIAGLVITLGAVKGLS